MIILVIILNKNVPNNNTDDEDLFTSPQNMQVLINPTHRYAVSDLLKDWNLDLTRRSLRFFGLL